MFVKVSCNTCIKSDNCTNLIECSLCLITIYLKFCFNVIDAEIMENSGSDRCWICIYLSKNIYFLLKLVKPK